MKNPISTTVGSGPSIQEKHCTCNKTRYYFLIESKQQWLTNGNFISCCLFLPGCQWLIVNMHPLNFECSCCVVITSQHSHISVDGGLAAGSVVAWHSRAEMTATAHASSLQANANVQNCNVFMVAVCLMSLPPELPPASYWTDRI